MIYCDALIQVFGDSCCLTNANRQYAARGRVERTRVSDAPLFQEFAHTRHDIVRSHARGFMNIEYAVHVMMFCRGVIYHALVHILMFCRGVIYRARVHGPGRNLSPASM